jgi:hypothetical protein
MVPKQGEDGGLVMITVQSMRRSVPTSTRCSKFMTLRRLCTVSVFSTVDLVRAFNQIPVAQEDMQQTAITTPFGLFEFPFMTFGLRNDA